MKYIYHTTIIITNTNYCNILKQPNNLHKYITFTYIDSCTYHFSITNILVLFPSNNKNNMFLGTEQT